MAEEAELAAKLAVPDEDRAAFAELAGMYRLRYGHVSETKMKDWREVLQKRRAQVQVKAFMQEHEAEIAEFSDSNGVPRLAIEQGMVFAGIYGQTGDKTALPLKDALDRVMADILAAKENPAPKDLKLTFQMGQFDTRHREIRKKAFPYTPASVTSEGDMTVDSVTPDGTLVGYIGFSPRGYIDDLAVLPAWQGRGVAKFLVCMSAKWLSQKGVNEIGLHVRACNIPAINLYKKLGFSLGENEFPGWYDWHGGYAMQASSAEVAARIS